MRRLLEQGRQEGNRFRAVDLNAKPGIKNGTVWCRFQFLDIPGPVNGLVRLTEGTRSDVADVEAGDTDVRQGVVGQVAKFSNGTAVVDPAFCDTNRVHDLFLRAIQMSSAVIACFVDILVPLSREKMECKENASAMRLCNAMLFRWAFSLSAEKDATGERWHLLSRIPFNCLFLCCVFCGEIVWRPGIRAESRYSVAMVRRCNENRQLSDAAPRRKLWLICIGARRGVSSASREPAAGIKTKKRPPV
jgi:hypothetical protein